ncbi:MAG: rod shape-determining protein MreC [Patescibacteria group bacterium]|nr:rod shape-determining protein MreC [Patescibacteria group bacterium]
MQRPKPHARTRLAIIISLIIISVALLFQLLGLWRPFRIVIDTITQPITNTFAGVTRWVGGSFATLGSLGQLSQENTDLQRQVSEKEAELARLREVEKENALLRAQLNFSDEKDLDLVGARVIAYSPDNVRRNITIDVGKADGIEEGMAVVSSGSMIGKIERVYDQSSDVFLVSDPEFRVLAMTQNGRAKGIVRGQLGSGLRMEQVAQNEVIDIGEFVVSSGSDRVPKGLPIGKIESIDRSDNEIFQAANVKPLVDMQRLEIVFVVKG